MVKGSKANIKSKYSDIKCEGSGRERESLSHVMVCPEFEDIRVNIYFVKYELLVKYFREFSERQGI